ncbi:MAG: zinc ribbon domain-containing protein [Candidatus Thermoplasmatota archaeon]|nr:zinc ribbon domain-containing protein [Candidatus Thermoplasmatota archaeon]
MTDKSLSSQSVSVLPVLLLGFTHVVVTPLREVFSIEPMLMIPYYLVGILIGIFIYRKSNTVKDYEYRRSKVMKNMKNVYAAEESGVWQTNVEVPDKITDEYNLSADVSVISKEAPELELSEDEKVEVSMLNESQRVIEATRRVSGQSTFDEQEVESTIGASRKSSPMDRFLDFLTGIVGNKSSREVREQTRLAALRAASQASPVKAEKPQAPIQYERNEVKIGPDNSYVDNFDDDTNNEFSNAVVSELQQVNKTSVFAPPKNDSTIAQSLESMAMLSSNEPTKIIQPGAPLGERCRACGYPIKPSDRFCENCGIDI